jgi:hypothetical protein
MLRMRRMGTPQNSTRKSRKGEIFPSKACRSLLQRNPPVSYLP